MSKAKSFCISKKKYKISKIKAIRKLKKIRREDTKLFSYWCLGNRDWMMEAG
jgi:hypothetical protein